MLVLGSCGSSAKATSTSSATTVESAAVSTPASGAATSAPGASTSTTKGADAALPSDGCLLSDAQVSELVGSPLKGTSTAPPGGTFCAYTGESGDAGVSVSVKHYDDVTEAKKIVDGLLSNTAKMYVDPKTIDVGDGGAVAAAGPLAYARFTVGNTFVEVTVRPGDEAKAEQAAKEVAAKL